MDQSEIEDLNSYIRILESLAAGRNPFTGEKLADDTLLNNVELVRCFFTAAKVMREYSLSPFSTPGAKSYRRRNSIPFSISEEEKQKLLTPFPLKISAFRSKVREAVGVEMDVPQAGAITQWLVRQGYLKIDTEIINGASSKIPTEEGEELGITFREIRTPDGKRYMQCFYSKDAQELILDNMDNILGYSGEQQV